MATIKLADGTVIKRPIPAAATGYVGEVILDAKDWKFLEKLGDCDVFQLRAMVRQIEYRFPENREQDGH